MRAICIPPRNSSKTKKFKLFNQLHNIRNILKSASKTKIKYKHVDLQRLFVQLVHFYHFMFWLTSVVSSCCSNFVSFFPLSVEIVEIQHENATLITSNGPNQQNLTLGLLLVLCRKQVVQRLPAGRVSVLLREEEQATRRLNVLSVTNVISYMSNQPSSRTFLCWS